MSMDEMLLQELYGSSEVQAEEQIKQAQVELVEAVAAEAGVDLNELSDDELTKFAHYVLSDEDEQVVSEEEQHTPMEEKLAEADLMGRQMAHSYVDQLQEIQQGEAMNQHMEEKIASAMYDVADAWQEKVAKEQPIAPPRSTEGRIKGMRHYRSTAPEGMNRAPSGPILEPDFDMSGRVELDSDKMLARVMNDPDTSAAEKASLLKRIGQQTGILGGAGMSGLERGLRGAGTAGAIGALGYGGYRLATKKKKKDKMKKKASYSDYMFEKLAENKEEKAKEGLKDRMSRYGRSIGDATGFREAGQKGRSAMNRNLRRGGTALGVLGLAGTGAYALSRRGKKKQEKKASLFLEAGYDALATAELYEPEEFAKEAEFRAAEILAANGVHPETFEDIEPQEIKVASFPGVEDAIDDHEAEALAEYNEMLDEAALHIIDSILED